MISSSPPSVIFVLGRHLHLLQTLTNALPDGKGVQHHIMGFILQEIQIAFGFNRFVTVDAVGVNERNNVILEGIDRLFCYGRDTPNEKETHDEHSG